jgi:hypothetical protein
MGVKSPNTVMKRANAIMMYYRWHAVHGHFPFLPFNESDVWQFVLSQQPNPVAASRSQSLVQALRFCPHVLVGFEKALECANSRRIVGQSHIQMSLKSPARQARPLSVAEERILHAVADGTEHSVVDRCIASGILLALYGRCRVSDTNFVHEILHDVTSDAGYLEVTTRYHKAARTAQQKALLLPIVISCAGVVNFPWIHSWIANRKAAGLPTSGRIDGALMPAPSLGAFPSWLQRPLSPGEVTNILRGFLKSDDGSLTSHSLKATTLSWAAKAEIPREQRRILGRHASTVQCADSFYSRDMSIGPVNSLKKVIDKIRDGECCPDASRANYFPNMQAAASGTPAHVVMQPFTPAYLERRQPGTPGLDSAVPQQEEKKSALAPPQFCGEKVKTESGWELLVAGTAPNIIEISSDDQSESSDSDTCEGTSGDDEPIDLDEVATVGPGIGQQEELQEPVVMAKNMKTKIIHECRGDYAAAVDGPEAFTACVVGKLTKCGKMVTSNYQLPNTQIDWTAKCRICFKGRRAPGGLTNQ